MFRKYLDPKKATIAALRDWRTQHWKAEQGKKHIQQINEQLTSIPSGMGEVCPSTHYAKNSDTSFARKYDQKDLAMRSYKESFEFVQKMGNCWKELNPTQQELLTLRFIDYEERNGIPKIMSRFNVSKREAYRMSDEALLKFKTLLYW